MLRSKVGISIGAHVIGCYENSLLFLITIHLDFHGLLSSIADSVIYIVVQVHPLICVWCPRSLLFEESMNI